MFDALGTGADRVPESEIATPPLGRVLVERGHLTDQQLQSALAEQARTGRPFGQVLIGLSYVTATTIAQALATQHDGLVETGFGFATGFEGTVKPLESSLPPVSPPATWTDANVIQLPQPVEPAIEELEPIALEESMLAEEPSLPFEPFVLPEPIALEPLVLPELVALEQVTLPGPIASDVPVTDLAAAVSERLKRAEELELEAARLAAELEAAKQAEVRVAELETARREADQRAESLIREAEQSEARLAELETALRDTNMRVEARVAELEQESERKAAALQSTLREREQRAAEMTKAQASEFQRVQAELEATRSQLLATSESYRIAYERLQQLDAVGAAQPATASPVAWQQ